MVLVHKTLLRVNIRYFFQQKCKLSQLNNDMLPLCHIFIITLRVKKHIVSYACISKRFSMISVYNDTNLLMCTTNHLTGHENKNGCDIDIGLIYSRRKFNW